MTFAIISLLLHPLILNLVQQHLLYLSLFPAWLKPECLCTNHQYNLLKQTSSIMKIDQISDQAIQDRPRGSTYIFSHHAYIYNTTQIANLPSSCTIHLYHIDLICIFLSLPWRRCVILWPSRSWPRCIRQQFIGAGYQAINIVGYDGIFLCWVLRNDAVRDLYTTFLITCLALLSVSTVCIWDKCYLITLV